MRKETHISTHKEEYKKGGEENRKHLENDPHTKKKKVKKVRTSNFVGGIFVQKQQGKLIVFSL